jgi:hypothetical protein
MWRRISGGVADSPSENVVEVATGHVGGSGYDWEDVTTDFQEKHCISVEMKSEINQIHHARSENANQLIAFR